MAKKGKCYIDIPISEEEYKFIAYPSSSGGVKTQLVAKLLAFGFKLTARSYIPFFSTSVHYKLRIWWG